MWSRPVVGLAVVGALGAAAGVLAYLLWPRDEQEDEEPQVEQPPSETRLTVARRARRLPTAALLDYSDEHGTALAGAFARLRKHPDAEDAVTEARRQHEVLGALLDELKLRAESAV